MERPIVHDDLCDGVSRCGQQQDGIAHGIDTKWEHIVWLAIASLPQQGHVDRCRYHLICTLHLHLLARLRPLAELPERQSLRVANFYAAAVHGVVFLPHLSVRSHLVRLRGDLVRRCPLVRRVWRAARAIRLLFLLGPFHRCLSQAGVC